MKHISVMIVVSLVVSLAVPPAPIYAQAADERQNPTVSIVDAALAVGMFYLLYKGFVYLFKSLPNADDRRQEFVTQNPGLDPDLARSILDGTIRLGMTADQVTASWGKPQQVNRAVGIWGSSEQWVYVGHYVYLENGVVTSWQTR